MKRFFLVIIISLSFNACVEESQLMFSESNQFYQKNANIEINIPVAEGDTELAALINSKIENHIANTLLFSEEDSETATLEEGISRFDTEYKIFKSDLIGSKNYQVFGNKFPLLIKFIDANKDKNNRDAFSHNPDKETDTYNKTELSFFDF